MQRRNKSLGIKGSGKLDAADMCFFSMRPVLAEDSRDHGQTGEAETHVGFRGGQCHRKRLLHNPKICSPLSVSNSRSATNTAWEIPARTIRFRAGGFNSDQSKIPPTSLNNNLRVKCGMKPRKAKSVIVKLGVYIHGQS